MAVKTKTTLSASHLFRRFLLFALTILFLLTMVRAAYGLWQFLKVDDAGAVVALFVQGLRFDLALIAIICIVPLVVGSLLSMTSVTRGLAKFIIVLFLMTGLLLVLALELITPWFIHNQGVRPDVSLMLALDNPVALAKAALVEHAIPLGIGTVLCILIFVAFWSRMEMQRFLRYRLGAFSAFTVAIVGGLACLMAIWSTPDLRQNALSPADSVISEDKTVNDLAMNSAYKTLHALAFPLLQRVRPTVSSDS